MNYFVKIDGARFVSFEGMTQETITTMLTDQNLTHEFVSESIYQEALESSNDVGVKLIEAVIL